VLNFYCIVCLLLLVYYFIMHFCFFIFVFLCVLYVHCTYLFGCHFGVINDDDIEYSVAANCAALPTALLMLVIMPM